VILAASVLMASGDQRPRRIAESPEQIIARFAEAESRLRDARNNYTFKQDVLIETLGEAGSVTGSFRRVSEIDFDDRSNRVEKITYFPPSTLRAITVTQYDLEDLGVIQPFALTMEDLPRYDIRYLRQERIDEIDTYVFSVAPKDPAGLAKRGQRYLTGTVWVEDQDYMIVKVAGQAGPETREHQYPRFETWREHIDGRYWFPTYTYADDVLEFENSNVHIKMVVKYLDYREFTGRITVVEDEAPDK
jgi:hypothetical protein